LESKYLLESGQTKKAIDSLLELDEILNKADESNHIIASYVLLTLSRCAASEKIIEIINSQNFSLQNYSQIMDVMKYRQLTQAVYLTIQASLVQHLLCPASRCNV